MIDAHHHLNETEAIGCSDAGKFRFLMVSRLNSLKSSARAALRIDELFDLKQEKLLFIAPSVGLKKV